MDINSKIAIVTGASSGLGTAISHTLIDDGATVYGLARSTNKLENIREELGENFIPVTLDITNHDAIDQWIADTFSDEHSPDILINNAGLGRFGNVDELTIDDWETMIRDQPFGHILYDPQHCAIDETKRGCLPHYQHRVYSRQDWQPAAYRL
ncbi:MAG: SDR family NAD(P)-dependent oxidoreductase [Fodinibius sp.]|nr:SDR family NAD(P)-dependent oxidoreductase [Fodinibius sp.]